LDSKWSQPGTDKSALITNTDKPSMLLLKESLIKEYKEEVTKIAKKDPNDILNPKNNR
jgi:hypothetical protein